MDLPSNQKILLALQYWEGDRQAALRLARYLADLEPKHSDFADFVLVRRFDCAADESIIRPLSRKFNTFVYRSPRRETGWPNGCNGLWFGTMEWVYSMMEAKRIPKYKAIFTFEADGGPVLRDWVAQLSAEWDRVNRPKTVVIAGPMVGGPDTNIHEHINGNALITGDFSFLNFVTRRLCGAPPGCGWDYCLYETFKQFGGVANIPRMRSYYNSPTFSILEYRKMQEEKLLWVHGCKDDSMIRHGRNLLLSGCK